ncbi:MAG: glycosyl transferase group 1 [Mucilaginibacter sp.]|nr:glycosyl transferase group 1 [Mucilaginibacter sp.]
MIKPIAIHLPQYYPFPENDEWWGKGFTEWTNVAKAKPLFKGHYQPHLPADLGFYDLRLEEARIAQAEMAKQYGIHGFCYYHYWFNGKRLLNAPVDAILQSGKPDFPFMLCWANENWTRRWDGADQQVLIKQNYSAEDDLKHIGFLMENFFGDKRYIRVDNKPFIIIYKPGNFPDIKKTLITWRSEAIKAGIELHIGFMKTSEYNELEGMSSGFDCVIDFQPNWNFNAIVKTPYLYKLKNKLRLGKSIYHLNDIYSYPKYVNEIIKHKADPTPGNYPGITPGWDNSPRKKKRAAIFDGSTPDEYGRWLKHIADRYKGHDTYLFINAWNEWAEGNHLEPDAKWGKQYLEQTAKILKDA